MFGMAGIDAMGGGAGNDILHGMAGNDNMEGGAGDDLIYGGAGADSMGGQEGADRFVWASAAEAPYDPHLMDIDWIYHFDALDRLDLSAIDANSDLAGVQHFRLVEGQGHEQGTLYFNADPGGWGWVFVEGYIDADDQPDFFVLITDDDQNGYPPVTTDSFILG